MSGPAACRWGKECKRNDCWFVHPEGRLIDQSPVTSPTHGAGMGAGPNAGRGASSAATACRFGRKCHRTDCYYPHPEGREIDESPKSSTRGGSSAASTTGDDDCPCCGGNPFECETPACAARGQCGCTFGMGLEDDDDEDEEAPERPVDDTWRDEWFADSRNCTCCKGYVYRCENKEAFCESGECYCTQPSVKPEESKISAPGGPSA